MPEHDTSPYPEHAALKELARARAPRFTGPDWLRELRDVVRVRGHDWCTSVLNVSFLGLGHINVQQAQMLLLAHEADIDPPLPARIAQARAAAHHDPHRDMRARLEATDLARWQEALAGCRVEVEVRPNSQGRRTGTGLNAGPLRHVVALEDVFTGSASNPRLHAAGRAVCETPARTKPRLLAEPVQGPATCVSCLRWMPRLRPTPGLTPRRT